MIKKLSLSVFLWCLLGAGAEILSQDREPDTFAALNRYIEMKVARDRIPGLAVCLMRDQKVVWEKGYGFQNTENGIPATVNTVMGTASISKIATAIAVLQLCEQNKLSLGDPIDKYLRLGIRHPAVPDAEMTIAGLLSHTASTSNGPSLWRCFSCGSQPMTRGEWVRAYFLPGGVYYDKEGNFTPKKPGEGFQYSNAGYGLLAYLVETASGMPFEEYCKRNIFQPLNMRNTTFRVAEVRKELLTVLYAYGYNMDIERDLLQPGIDCGRIIDRDYFLPLCYYSEPFTGASGMYSSVEDLSILLGMLMNGGAGKGVRILSKASVDTLLCSYVEPKLLPRQFASYGLGGYALRLAGGEPVHGHSGAAPGMSSFLLFDRTTNIGAIVLANVYVDIRDLIEWLFAEGVPRLSGRRDTRTVTFRIIPNYLPGGSRLFIIGNHHTLGSWINAGIPLSPRNDRRWETTITVPDSTKLEFKITRGKWTNQAVTMDGKELPNRVLTVNRDTVVTITVEDWKDQAQQ